jgi:hypothetical protein
MKTLEHWVLRVADSDMTWVGLNWLRPAKHQRIGYVWIVFSSMMFALPGIAAGAGLIYLVLGHVDSEVWVSLFVLVVLVELALCLLSAHYWNRRAESLVQSV